MWLVVRTYAGPTPSLQLWPRLQFDEALTNSKDSCLSAIVDLKLVENITNMVLYGFFAQIQVIRNFLIGLTVCD